MREVIHRIRKAIIDALTGNVELRGSAIPIYGRVPSNATYPFVRIYQFQMMRLIRIEHHIIWK